jgi:hypothetical protein
MSIQTPQDTKKNFDLALGVTLITFKNNRLILLKVLIEQVQTKHGSVFIVPRKITKVHLII